MNDVARRSLQKLLASAERAWGRRGEISASLVFSEASNSEYFALASATEKRVCHSTLIHAEHKGAITVEWDKRAGHNNQVKRIRLVDGNALAELLDIVPRWRAIEDAAQLLIPCERTFPIIASLLAAWRNGRQPRGLQPTDARAIADAARAIEYCRANGTQDVPIRRLSTQLGFDSKHIESLTAALDLLTAADLDQVSREPEEVFAGLGIVKHPLPVLLSGPATLNLNDRSTFTLPLPYAGVSPTAIASIRVDADCRYVLSVENLTSFHELTQFESSEVLLIYSNGMPSPSWCRLYQRLVAELPDRCVIWHWGDVDGGGYRIAARIAEICIAQQRRLRLHLMNPAVLPSERRRRSLDTRERTQMERLARQMNWTKEAEGLLSHPYAFEQEALDVFLPGPS